MKKLLKKRRENSTEPLNNPWKKFYGDVKPNLVYSQGTIVEFLENTVNKYPNNIAYEYYGMSATFKEFYERIIEVAKALKMQGVKENDRVTICMPNTPQGLMAFYAVNMIGATANMIHPLSAEKEIEFYLNVSDSNFLITIDIAYNKVMEIIDNTHLEKVVVVSAANDFGKSMTFFYWLTKGRKINVKIERDYIISWRKFIEAGKKYTGTYKCHKTPDSIAAILYSGGTTGTPKGIMLSNKNFNAVAVQALAMCHAKPGESILAIMPIFHGFGLSVCIHTPLVGGMKCILIPEFSSKKFVNLIRKYHPNFIAGVPTLFDSLTRGDFGPNELATVTNAICGGDSLDPTLKERVDKFLNEHGSTAIVREGYGLTESAGATCLTPDNYYRKGSIGIPFPDTYFKIVINGTHDEAPANTDGEICISGPSVMVGYLNNLEETMQTLRTHEDGHVWLHTGDIGSMDEDGFVYFKQRLKRVIISSGYNIYPSHVEKVINEHPAVLTSTVIGVSHPHKVQVAKAYIVLNEGITLTNELKKDIEEHCQRNLAKYTMPYYFEYRDSLPRTLVGKVAYKELEKVNNK